MISYIKGGIRIRLENRALRRVFGPKRDENSEKKRFQNEDASSLVVSSVLLFSRVSNIPSPSCTCIISVLFFRCLFSSDVITNSLFFLQFCNLLYSEFSLRAILTKISHVISSYFIGYERRRTRWKQCCLKK